MIAVWLDMNTDQLAYWHKYHDGEFDVANIAPDLMLIEGDKSVPYESKFWKLIRICQPVKHRYDWYAGSKIADLFSQETAEHYYYTVPADADMTNHVLRHLLEKMRYK